MHSPIPHRRVPSLAAVAVTVICAACDAGVVTAPVLGEAGGDGGVPFDPADPDPDLDGREVFESQVLPLLDLECGACHGDDSRGVGFLGPPDPYASALGWPGLVTAGDPTESELVTHGAHAGPALRAATQRVVESWILLEGAAAEDPDPGDDGPSAGGDPGPGGDTRPMAVFTTTPTEAEPRTLLFDASSSTDPEGDISLYEWDFGDGTVGFGMAVTHTYAVPDTYAVELTVTDRSGSAATARQLVDVGGAGGPRVLQLVLVDADSDSEVPVHTPLSSGAVIDRAALGTSNFSIRADATDDAASLRFSVDGVTDFQTENNVPFALAGDSGGDYGAWTPEAGEHTVTATPYTEADASGTAGTPVTITLTVL